MVAYLMWPEDSVSLFTVGPMAHQNMDPDGCTEKQAPANSRRTAQLHGLILISRKTCCSFMRLSAVVERQTIA